MDLPSTSGADEMNRCRPALEAGGDGGGARRSRRRQRRGIEAAMGAGAGAQTDLSARHCAEAERWSWTVEGEEGAAEIWLGSVRRSSNFQLP